MLAVRWSVHDLMHQNACMGFFKSLEDLLERMQTYGNTEGYYLRHKDENGKFNYHSTYNSMFEERMKMHKQLFYFE